MSSEISRRIHQWLPATAVAIVVLLAGGRLISLSVREHAEDLRQTAQQTVNRSARGLEARLARLGGETGAGQTTELAQHLAGSAPLKQLGPAGYHYEITEVDPGSRFRQVLLRSQTAPLEDPARSVVRPPPGFLRDTPNGHLELAITPRNGWYPASELATSIGLLAIVTWLLAFGAHDLTHALQRARETTSSLKQRVRDLNQKLAAEIDSRQKLQQSFEHARYHDVFTGLPNRRFFMDRLDRALRDVRARNRQRLAIVLMDVDRFQLINDTLGQTAANELMLQVSRRLSDMTGTRECVLARWRENQFAALVLDVGSSEAALAIADSMHEALGEPFELRRHRMSVGARMGVTSVESGLIRAEEALRQADIALSVAKRTDGVRTLAYSPAMGGDAASLVSLEADLHTALQRNEFRLLFQPIVDLRRDRVVGAEALLRWNHPMEGVLEPARFLAIAEEAGLLLPITRWVILRVCRLAGEWRRRLPADVPFFFSINLSATALRDPGFVDYVALALRDTGTPPSTIKFELTEGGLVSDVGTAREILEHLHDLGVELMLDDFGTGYSSLSYLQLFPFDYLKIDRPLVDRTGSQDKNDGITSAVLQMASSLSIKTVAEIVETPSAAAALARMGCDYAQGFFFSEPLEAEDALQRLWSQGGVQAAEPEGEEDDSPTLVLSADWVSERIEEGDDQEHPPPFKRAL